MAECKKILSNSYKKRKFYQFNRKLVKFELQLLHILFFIRGKNKLDTQVAISTELHSEFWNIRWAVLVDASQKKTSFNTKKTKNGLLIKENPNPLIHHCSTTKIHDCAKYGLVPTYPL